jgi:hypothetical protein
MSDMRVMLEQIDEILRVKAPMTYGSLRPAARPEELDTLRSRGDILADVAALWEWHNSTNPEGSTVLELVPMFEFLSISAAARYWDMWRDAKSEFPYSPWRPDWVTIGANGCGGILVADHNGQIFLATPEAGEFVHDIASSPQHLVQQLLTALRDEKPFDGFIVGYPGGTLAWQPKDENSVSSYDRRYPS